MSEDLALADAEATLAKFSGPHRAFFVPITRAISLLGGRARKRDVVIKLRELLADECSEQQLDYLETNNRFSWARLDLKKTGLVGGEYGWWELTELGRAHAAAHAADPLDISIEIPEASQPPPRNRPTETVEVTAFGAYEIPALEAMASGLTDRGQIIDAVREQLGGLLRPGDARVMAQGVPVYEFRIAWALSNLGKAGLAENPETGQWKITPAGRVHLEDGRGSWDFHAFAKARAKVLLSRTAARRQAVPLSRRGRLDPDRPPRGIRDQRDQPRRLASGGTAAGRPHAQSGALTWRCVGHAELPLEGVVLRLINVRGLRDGELRLRALVAEGFARR